MPLEDVSASVQHHSPGLTRETTEKFERCARAIRMREGRHLLRQRATEADSRSFEPSGTIVEIEGFISGPIPEQGSVARERALAADYRGAPRRTLSRTAPIQAIVPLERNYLGIAVQSSAWSGRTGPANGPAEGPAELIAGAVSSACAGSPGPPWTCPDQASVT
jgi:hypothetical protein